MPPENSCGYWREAVGGRVDADLGEQRDRALARLRLRDARSCWRIASTSWNSIVFTGLSEPSASWKIIEIRPPRTPRSTSSDAPASSSSPSRIEPRGDRGPAARAGRAPRARASTSPSRTRRRRATRCPRRISSAARSTARTTPPWIGYSTTQVVDREDRSSPSGRRRRGRVRLRRSRAPSRARPTGGRRRRRVAWPPVARAMRAPRWIASSMPALISR